MENGKWITADGQSKIIRFPFSIFHFPFSVFSRLCVLILIFAGIGVAQKLPDEIRGYKVHKAQVTVTDQSGKTEKTDDRKDKPEARARVGDPVLVDTSLTGLTFEITAEIDSIEQSGKVDFLMFRDFRVNGLEVEIEEYRESFEFKKNQVINLPKPVKIFLGSREALKGAFGEIKNSKDEWTVTGTVFVFGRFKKFGFDFKRVVPVEVRVKIKNPIKNETILSDVMPSF